jgi:hypothetical protein
MGKERWKSGEGREGGVCMYVNLKLKCNACI